MPHRGGENHWGGGISAGEEQGRIKRSGGKKEEHYQCLLGARRVRIGRRWEHEFTHRKKRNHMSLKY